jgi:hypothetical protein
MEYMESHIMGLRKVGFIADQYGWKQGLLSVDGWKSPEWSSNKIYSISKTVTSLWSSVAVNLNFPATFNEGLQ